MLSLEYFIAYKTILPIEIIIRIFYYYKGLEHPISKIIQNELKKNLIRKIYSHNLIYDQISYKRPYTYITRRENYYVSNPNIQTLVMIRKAFIYHIYIKPITNIYGSEYYNIE